MTPSIQGVEIGPRLGEGAFGVVYRARHLLLDVDVAVKVIDSTKIGDAAGVDLAVAEARLMAHLDHPNLLRIFQALHDARIIHRDISPRTVYCDCGITA